MKRLHDQERAVARILELGGHIEYDYERFDWNSAASNPKPPGPKWIRRLLGPHWNVSVAYVAFPENVDVAVEELQVLKTFRNLRMLSLGYNKSISNDSLVVVGELRELDTVHLAGCPTITDAGLAHLSKLAQLRRLLLYGCNIDGSGIEHLSKLPIEELDLQSTNVSDENLFSLRELTTLRRLNLADTRVTGRALTSIRNLVNLRNLYLQNTGVDDEGLRELAALSRLDYLYLWNTKVTDEGVAKLKESLPALSNLEH
jgi:hypothetical protein